jgi:succinate dehydrogenase / fumarate reductase, flavoprotein subunit
MTALPREPESLSADLLVIGGGFAGVWAAYRAAELGASVVLAEKGFVRRAGASTVSGGVTTCPQDDDDLDLWVREFVVRGGYMCDQDWTRQLLEGARERVRALDAWGVPIVRDEHGRIRRFLSRGMVDVRCMQYQPKKTLEELRRRILAMGVRIADRLNIVDLLTTDGAYPTRGAVCGAIGFHVRDGTPYVIRAKRTMLATGNMGMKGLHLDNAAFDGTGLAYRAGACLVDLEMAFGGTFTVLEKRYNLGGYNVAIAHGGRLINARGERFMEKYDPERLERSELNRVVAAFVKELVDGRGPCYLDLRFCDEGYWSNIDGAAPRASQVLVSGELPDPRVHPLLVEPTWGMFNHGGGGAQIDLRSRTSLAGLFAGGSSAKNAAAGTHQSAGIPTAFAMNSGYVAGEQAARDAREIELPVLPAYARELLARVFAPLGRTAAGASPNVLQDRMAELECDVVDQVINSAAKLERKIAVMDGFASELACSAAADLHDLVKFYEARNVIDGSRVVYRSALDRTESRETFYREDYPETDDRAWFCWHRAIPGAAGPAFERQRIPLERYPVQPPLGPPAYLSPISAMMRGCYEPALYA